MELVVRADCGFRFPLYDLSTIRPDSGNKLEYEPASENVEKNYKLAVGLTHVRCALAMQHVQTGHIAGDSCAEACKHNFVEDKTRLSVGTLQAGHQLVNPSGVTLPLLK